MAHPILDEPASRAATSPLLLSDRLLSLARDADRAGLRLAAGRLVDLACAVLDEPAPARG